MEIRLLRHASTACALLLGVSSVHSTETNRGVDVVVYGGTASGVVTAVQAARMGKSVVIVEPGRHLGGLTSGGLGATDSGKKETVGGVAREFYRRVKTHYDNPSAWTREKPSQYKPRNHAPEVDGVMWYFEPSVAENILNDMIREANVSVVYGERLDLRSGVRKSGLRITEIVMESGRSFPGLVFIDATYEGDLMAKAGVSYTWGREGNAQYQETLNGVQAKRLPFKLAKFFRPVDPYRIEGDPKSGLLYGIHGNPPGEEGSADKRVQAYCYRLCLTDVPENQVPFDKPDGYDPADYELILRWLDSEKRGRAFANHPDPEPIENPAIGRNPYLKLMPNRKTDSNTKGPVGFDFIGGNYDYPDGDYAVRERIVRDHIRWQKGLLWFMANDPRVPEKMRDDTRRWGHARDEFVDTGNWPHQLYVREARRMIGSFVMTEHEIMHRRRVHDPVALGSYSMDSHQTQRFVTAEGVVQNEGSMGGVAGPYGISYRALVPKAAECDNLLVPVCVSSSHCAYGSIRMEPVYMMLGQVVGTAAALAIDGKRGVQAVEYAALRERLLRDGQRLEHSGRK